MLKNITETLVMQKLDSLWKNIHYDGCRCEKCREDILAYTLNRIPPKYVSTNEGELYAKTQSLSAQYDFATLRVLAMAMKLVGDNPRHDEMKNNSR